MKINTINQYELNILGLHYLPHCHASLVVGLSFKVKSGFEGRENCSCSGLSDEPVNDNLCAGTDWYYWNIQESAEEFEQIIPF
jgi:hypothetical protein